MCGWYFRLFGGNPNDPCAYIFIGSNPPSCPGTGKICAIYACDDGFGCPIITTALQTEMITALSTGADQLHVLLRSAN